VRLVPPIPKPKTPIEQAIEAIQAAQARGTPPPTSITLSEGAMAQVRDLVKNSPVVPTGGPLRRAATLMGVPLNQVQGRQVTGISWDEAGHMSKSQLERDLEDSLWALATLHTPVFTHEQLQRHLSAGHLSGTTMVKRVFDVEVHVLCPCKTILVMYRCRGPVRPIEAARRCEEFVLGPGSQGARFCARCIEEVSEGG
jgi:hypothetical protein